MRGHGIQILMAALSGILFGAVAPAAARDPAVIADTAYTHAQTLVEVQPGRRLNLYCTGKGSPTVIFEAGQGDSTRVWGLVQPSIASKTRACSYDRAGLGFSDPSTRPSTSANIVKDLRRLLSAARIKPPYVLVGHSSAGMYIKLYAETNLDEIAGMVFVDPSHEDLGKTLWKMDPAYQAKYPSLIATQALCLKASPSDFLEGSDLFENCIGGSDPHYSKAINDVEIERAKSWGRRAAWTSEQDNIWFDSSDQVRASYRPLGDIPLVVLSHEPLPRTRDETQELRDAKNQLWIRVHREIAAMSSRGTVETVTDAGHYIELDQPKAVIDAIARVVSAAR
jgi:pimeloyl-ACP methyl ester carboxylesterase